MCNIPQDDCNERNRDDQQVQNVEERSAETSFMEKYPVSYELYKEKGKKEIQFYT